jgi:hypothetical protein
MHMAHIGIIQLVGHAERLVATDKDVRPGEDASDLSQHRFDRLVCRRQFGIEPCASVLRAGRRL